MSDKSKLPDLKELSSMASKLFKGLKASVEEIVKDYKDKRSTPVESETETAKPKRSKKTKSS